MRRNWRDVVATMLVIEVAVAYLGYAVFWGSVPFIHDPTGIGGLGLILGMVGAAIGGWIAVDRTGLVRSATIGVGLVAFALGCLTLVSENFFDVTVRNVLLTAFVATIVTLWASAIARHVARAAAPPSGAAHA